MLIYHYTDLNAAISIARHSKLWLTDTRFLNDKEEFLLGLEYLIKTIAMFNEYPDGTSDNFKEFIADWSGKTNASNFFPELLFVSSLSRGNDSLSQWRSYGMYSVGLEEESLADYNNNDDFYYLECRYIYDTRDGLEVASEVFSSIILPSLLGEWQDDGDNSLMHLRLNDLISIYALLFKNYSFADENEVRIVINCSDEDNRIKFRPRGNILIPYVEIEIDRYALKEIKVGPVEHQELAMHSLDLFARSISDDLIKSGSVNIEYEFNADFSNIPYRSL